MTKFLLYANLSPETGRFLAQRFGFDVTDLITVGQAGLSDEAVVELAKRESRVVITFDRGFGEIYHRREQGRLGVLILRLADQSVESVNQTLARFFTAEANSIDLDHSLVIIEEDRLRIVRGSP